MTGPATLGAEVEQFLYCEAELLDAWRLDEWLTLFHEGSRYEVPSTDRPDGSPGASQMLISDDYERLKARARRLQSHNAHAERPRSRLARIVGNVVADEDGGSVAVRATGVTWRFQGEEADHYVVRYRHRLSRATDGSLRFDLRRIELVPERLVAGSRLSFVL